MAEQDARTVVDVLKRAHKMSISGPDVPDDATTYGLAAMTLERVLDKLDDATEELRDRSQDDRKAAERRSWARLVPEDVLYPDHFSLLGTKTGAGLRGRLGGSSNRIYQRNFNGLLLPIPGEVWQHDESGRRFLVLAAAEHLNHAVMDVMEYAGPIPEAKD